MFEFFTPVMETAKAVSWSWYGAATLCFLAGGLLIFFLKQPMNGALVIAIGVGLGAIGTIYTQRDLARAEAKQRTSERDEARLELTQFKQSVADAAEKSRRAAEEKEKKDAAKVAARIKDLNTRLASVSAERDELVQRVLDHQRADRDSSGKVSSVSAAPGGPGSSESAGVPSGPVDYKAAFEKLTVDAARTAQLFATCRDTWRDVAQNAGQRQ